MSGSHLSRKAKYGPTQPPGISKDALNRVSTPTLNGVESVLSRYAGAEQVHRISGNTQRRQHRLISLRAERWRQQEAKRRRWQVGIVVDRGQARDQSEQLGMPLGQQATVVINRVLQAEIIN